MKKQKRFLSLLFGCLSFAAMHAQTYVDMINSTYNDDALVDMQYNITHLRPEGLFKLGTGFNVLTFNETNGAVMSSKFVVAIGKTITPKCIAQAGTQSFVFCEDANNIYFTSLNPVTGVIAYTKSIPRADLYFYTQLSPVDADYDGSSTLHALFRCKNKTNPAVWNLVHLQINVSTGTITSGSTVGIDVWDMMPNDIEYVDAQHIYISGSWRVHSPTTNVFKFMLFNIKATSGWNIIDITLPNNRPRSLYVKYRNTYLYLVGDSYHPSLLAAGPLAVLRMTDNNNGTMTLNSQLLYSAPGATFFIHDVQEEYGILVASGELPTFITGAPSAPRNFLYNSLNNTAMMSEYNMGGNVNIRTVYSGVSLRLFSVAKEDNMALSMHDLRTDVNATTLSCRHTPLSLYVPVDPVTVASVSVVGKSVDPVSVAVSTADSYNPYTWQDLCSTRTAAAPGEETALPGMRYYPNPADGIVRIENIETATRIRLYDTEGRLLLERALEPGTPSAEIDLTSLAPGIYLLETDQNGERTRARLIRK